MRESGEQQGGREVIRAQYFLGVDLGQAHDPTAVALVERAEMVGEWDAVVYAYRRDVELRLRHLRRMPLGTPYPEIVAAVAQMCRSQQVAGRCQVAVDGTGVGRPVVDLLREEQLGCKMLPVIVTTGQQETERDGYCYVPKRDLIVGLQVWLQRKMLRISRGLEYGAALVKELADMRVKLTTAGNEVFGAWRNGEHDDMVFAVALACWAAGRSFTWPSRGEAAYWLTREPWRWRR